MPFIISSLFERQVLTLLILAAAIFICGWVFALVSFLAQVGIYTRFAEPILDLALILVHPLSVMLVYISCILKKQQGRQLLVCCLL